MKFFSVLGFALLSATMLSGPTFAASKPPLQIIVSKDQQHLVVYDGDRPIAESKVSTGKPGHTTPSGIFSIIEKQEFHRSNKYSNAPMPWMQRITWSGVALHESNSVPNYPASHGCVRLPAKFAKALFGRTERGYHVIISDAPVQPTLLTGDNLLIPKMGDDSGLFLSDANMRPTFEPTNGQTVEVAMNEVLPKLGAEGRVVFDNDRSPIRVLMTRPTPRDTKRNAATVLNGLGFDTSIDFEDGVKKFQTANNLKADGKLTDDVLALLYKVAGKGTPPNGQLLVRRDFKPLLESPINIANPEIALGTHFMEARYVKRRAGKVEWYGLTLENRLPASAMKRLGITADPDGAGIDTTEDTLSRIEIPEAVKLQLETLLAEGSSITITDLSHEQETGEGTDFITVTKPGESG